LSLIVQFGLSKYLKHNLAPGDRVLKDKRGRPLLDYAMSPLPGLEHDLITKDVVAVLIEHVADPNEEFGRRTCWQNALLWQYQQFPISEDRTSTIWLKARKMAEIRLEIFTRLIEKGASVNAYVKTDQEKISLAVVFGCCFSSCPSFGELQQLVASQTAKSHLFSVKKKLLSKKKGRLLGC